MKIQKTILLAIGLVLGHSVFAESNAFQPAFVDTLVAPYLQMQQGLAADDLKSAQVGATQFLAAMKQAPQQGDAHEEAMALSKAAKTIASAGDISAARAAFLELSNVVTSLIKHIGVTIETPLHLAHCPMAFAGNGGDWLQSDTQVANPYYGSMMLRCGSVKEQLSGKPTEAEAHSHTGHAH